MKKINVAINGFGRIGRAFLREVLHHPNINIVAINDAAPFHNFAHLLQYDSVHGKLKAEIVKNDTEILVNEHKIKTFQISNIEALPWKKLNIDVVIESTGVFTDKESLQKHITAGAKKVILTAPSISDDIKTIVLGVNDHILNSLDNIISNASCTTNCAAPMLKVLQQFKISDVYVSTIHSYTSDQRLQDAPHKDMRRARAAALNIIPTSTGAAKALGKVFPELKGKIGGCGMRVPVPNGSLTDITCVIQNKITVQQINEAFKEAAQGSLKNILEYTTDPIVSSDVIGNKHSVVFDSEFTSVVDTLVKVIGWYDNEIGYSNRLIDLIIKINHLKFL